MTVTRPHHPLVGRTFEVASAGRAEVSLRTTSGTRLRLPRAWTDIDGALVAHPLELDAVATVEHIRKLAALLDALRDRR